MDISEILVQGQNDNNDRATLAMTAEGHAEVAIHAPRLPFGSVHTEKLDPIFQADAVYGINPGLVAYSTSLSGGVTVTDSSFVISTGNTQYALADIQSRKRLRYRAGQGSVGRFAGLFTQGVADSYQVAGLGHAEDGFYFGYKGASFGILHTQRGQRTIQTMTVGTASSTSENVNVILNGATNTVAVTNSGNIPRTVWEIATGTYNGWRGFAGSSNTVVFLANSAAVTGGTFYVSATTAGTTFAVTRAGLGASETFITQSNWNGDRLLGLDASGVTLNPQRGNVYEIGMQYLDYGSIEFKTEVATPDGNNADFVTVHTIKNPNNLTATHVRNPSFPFTMAVYSAGSTNNLSIKVGSFAGFIEGEKKLHGNRFSYLASSTSVGAATILPLFTVMNKLVYGGIANQAVVNLMSVVGAIKHTSPVIYYLIRNGTLGGNPAFADYATNSCTSWDTSATSVTYATNDQLIATIHVGDTGEVDYHFDNMVQEVTLQPGEWVTIGAKSTTGTPAYVTAGLNTREDQ